jgi:uncharacterized alkaline shock family protein YloU
MDGINEKMESQVPEEDQVIDTEEEVMTEEPQSVQGSVHISEDVITELAKRSLSNIEGVQAGSPGLASKLGLGRKATEGVRISLDENAGTSEITVDVYVMVKYGLRIPDLAWDVQECVKKQLEDLTGYVVKAINVNVQGIYFADELKEEPAGSVEEEPVVEEQFEEATPDESETEEK